MNLSFLFFLRCYLFIFRKGKGEREGEKHRCVVVSHTSHNPGMCPDRWPFGSKTRTQSTEPYQPGLNLSFLSLKRQSLFLHLCVCAQPWNLFWPNRMRWKQQGAYIKLRLHAPACSVALGHHHDKNMHTLLLCPWVDRRQGGELSQPRSELPDNPKMHAWA